MSAGAEYAPTGRALLAEAAERLDGSADYLLQVKVRFEAVAGRLDDRERIDGAAADAILEVVRGVESTLRLMEHIVDGVKL